MNRQPIRQGHFTHGCGVPPWNQERNTPFKKAPIRQRAKPLDRPAREARADLSRLLGRRETLPMAAIVHRTIYAPKGMPTSSTASVRDVDRRR